MAKILVITTGGTIESVLSNGVIAPDMSTKSQLIDNYQNNYSDDISFEIINFSVLLSENINPDFWVKLYETIMYIDFTQYNGIIITHGSDTLCYTSCALSLLLNNIPIPVIITASNYPLGDKRTNGYTNFNASVRFILKTKFNGVFCAWSNDNVTVNIHIASHIMQSRTFENKFIGITEPICIITNDTIKLSSKQSECHNNTVQFKRINPVFSTDILRIMPYPGLNYNNICITGNIKAILHETYHSSTVCTEDGNFSIENLIIRCKEYDIPLFIAPFDSKGGIYKSEKIYETENVYILKDISSECAIIKLMLACGLYNNSKDIVNFMKNDICYERKI